MHPSRETVPLSYLEESFCQPLPLNSPTPVKNIPYVALLAIKTRWICFKNLTIRSDLSSQVSKMKYFKEKKQLGCSVFPNKRLNNYTN
jgi:hypothetical protein